MKKGVKFIFIFLFCGFVDAKFLSKIDIEYMYDTNVYKDNSNMLDNGINFNCDLTVLGRILKNTYPRINYSLNVLNFFTNNFNNQSLNFIEFVLKQRLSNLVTIGFGVGDEILNYQQLGEFSSTNIFYYPFISLYPFYFTEIGVNLTNSKVGYSSYDLDYNAFEINLFIKQDLFWDTNLSLEYRINEKNYTERFLYVVLNNLVSNTDELRKDKEQNISVNIEKYFTLIGKIILAYEYMQLDSNANEIYWGPLQTKDNNTVSGDEIVLADYWDYSYNQINFTLAKNIISNLLFEFNIRYQDKKYIGWCARDAEGVIINKDVFRTDKNILTYFLIEKSMTNRAKLNIKYSY